jgi:gluconolactonase
MALSVGDVRTLASGLDHPEGVALGPDGLLYAGGEEGQIYRIDPANGAIEQIADTGGFVGGVCLDAAGAVYACNADRHAVLRVDPASGHVDTWCASAGGAPLRQPNWAAFEADGSLVVSDSGSEHVADGTLVRVPPGGGDGEVLDLPPLFFPNGLAIAADGAVLFVESFEPRLRALRDDGLVDVCALPGMVPDGVAIDVEGGVVVSAYYPFRIVRVPPGGSRPELLIEDPLGTRLIMPTNVYFFGDGLRSLAIAALGGHDITAVDLPVAGLPLHYPATT